MNRHYALLSLGLLWGCPSEVDRARDAARSGQVAAPVEQPAAAADEQPDPRVAKAPAKAKNDEAVEADPGRIKLAEVSTDVPLPVSSMLGKKPAEVEALLGEPTGKGVMRKSCVRFLPERTWFECDYAWQRYADKTGNYAAIQVGYEDGVSTSVAYEGVTADGDFDPRKALMALGVSLPGQPKESEPAEGVKLWSWFNSDARLMLDKHQYRVEVSTRDGKWQSSKVEFILNHPLTEAQKAKIKRKG